MDRLRRLIERPWAWFVGGAIATLTPLGAFSMLAWLVAWSLDGLPGLLLLAGIVVMGSAAWLVRHGADLRWWLVWAVGSWCIWIGFFVVGASMLTPVGELSIRIALWTAITMFLGGGALAVALFALATVLSRVGSTAPPVDLEQADA